MTTRSTKAGQTYLDLRKKAKSEGRNTDELLQLHSLEAFLDRLAASPHRASFSLKGGVLLLAYGVRRPTRDVDLSTHTLPNAVPTVRAIIEEIAQVPRDDGWSLSVLDAETIREEDAYSGVRITLEGTLDRAQLKLHVDVSFGDPISPPAELVSIVRVLGGTLEVPGCGRHGCASKGLASAFPSASRRC